MTINLPCLLQAVGLYTEQPLSQVSQETALEVLHNMNNVIRLLQLWQQPVQSRMIARESKNQEIMVTYYALVSRQGSVC
jgi:hypothetical protein